MPLSLEGKVFCSVANAVNGEVDGNTVFRFSQKGSIVSAVYEGGSIAQGHLLATMDAQGNLEMRYHHLNRDGHFKIGKCRSTYALLADGRLRYDEQWQWLCDDFSTGTSAIEEVPLE